MFKGDTEMTKGWDENENLSIREMLYLSRPRRISRLNRIAGLERQRKLLKLQWKKKKKQPTSVSWQNVLLKQEYLHTSM